MFNHLNKPVTITKMLLIVEVLGVKIIFEEVKVLILLKIPFYINTFIFNSFVISCDKYDYDYIQWTI